MERDPKSATTLDSLPAQTPVKVSPDAVRYLLLGTSYATASVSAFAPGGFDDTFGIMNFSDNGDCRMELEGVFVEGGKTLHFKKRAAGTAQGRFTFSLRLLNPNDTITITAVPPTSIAWRIDDQPFEG